MNNKLTNEKLDYLTSQTILIDALGTDNFFTVLVKWINTYIAIDSSSTIYYNKTEPPKLLFVNLNEHEKTLFYARFMDGAYVATPAYQGFINGYIEGLHSWDKLMPQGFKSSQIYASYYQPSCIEDLAYFFINIDNIGCIQFCLGRHSPNQKFTKEDLTSLETMSDFITSIIRKNWEVVLNQKEQELLPLSSIVSDRVSYLLNNFESTLLTARERDIAKLVITGHSSQSAADKLHISPGTERVHRAKLYAKLNLRSSSELFSYFLHQLTNI